MKTAAEKYVELTRRLFVISLVVLGVAIIGGSAAVGSAVLQLLEAQSERRDWQALSEDAARALTESEVAVQEAALAVSEADAELEAALARVNAEQAQIAREFDAAVEELARRGEISRNPMTGLGIPPQWLLDIHRDSMDFAFEPAGVAARVAGWADDALERAEADRDTNATVADAMDAGASQARLIEAARTDAVFARVTVAVVVVFVLALISAAFGISAARAKASIPEHHPHEVGEPSAAS